MNHTANLHLPQWEKTDRIMMDDFNAAMAAIDAGIVGAGPKFVTGTYTGDGTCGSSNPTSLTFGFAPKVVFLFDATSDAYVRPTVLLCCGSRVLYSMTEPSSGYKWNYTFSGNTVSWYFTGRTWNHMNGDGSLSPNDGVYQCNSYGRTYGYLAIG